LSDGRMAGRYDVVVVGGGPAGISAAKAASSEGGKVLLLEMQAKIGGTRSAVWVPSSMLKKGLREAVVSRPKESRLRAPHGEALVNCSKTAIIDPHKFNTTLAAEAIRSGADIWLSSPVRGLVVKDGAVRGVHAEAGGWSENVECEVVVDATGAGGNFSGLLLREVLKGGWKRELLAFSNEYLMANSEDEKCLEVFFDSYSAPGGHAWVYPLTKGFATSGICGLRIHPDAALDEFLGRTEIKRLEKAVPVAATRGQLPLEGPIDRTCADGIIAVGGSAGQIYPISGQGMRYALRCGEIAGEVAIDAVTEGDISGARLSEYERIWRSEFGEEFEIGSIIRSSLSVSQDRKMDAIIAKLKDSPALRRSFVDIFNGFEVKRSLRALLADEDIKRTFGEETVERLQALRRGI
jgi:digeranylgeranylglycerophospholipid reductase